LNKHSLKSYVLSTLLIIALCAVYCIFGGLLQMALGLLISALLAVNLYHYHYGYGVLNSLLIVVVFALFAGVLSAVTSAVPLILLAVSLALGTRDKMRFNLLLMVCSLIHIASLLVGFWVADSLSGGNVTFSAMMLETGQILQDAMQAQYPQPEMQHMLEEVIGQTIDLAIMLSPAIFMIISVLLSYVLIVIYKKLQAKHEVDMAFLPPFEALQTDRVMAVLFLVLFLILLVAPVGLFADAAANVVLLFSFLFMTVGMSVFDTNMKRRGTPKTSRRIFIAFSLFLILTLMVPAIVFIICGLLDSFLDFRKLSGEKEE